MNDLAFEPILSRVTLQDSIYQRLRFSLMRGMFDPGQTLTIAYLADAFGTSHMPVREALRRLAAENALEIGSTGSARVPSVTRKKLDDLCIARIAVESAAATLGAENLSAAAIASLERNISAHLEAGLAGKVRDMSVQNQEFHFAFYQECRSDVMIQLVETLWLRFGPYLRLLDDRYSSPPKDSADAERLVRNHRRMLSAAKKRAFADVGKWLKEDILSTQRLLQAHCVEVVAGKTFAR